MKPLKYACFSVEIDGKHFRNCTRREVCFFCSVRCPKFPYIDDFPDEGSGINGRGQTYEYRRLRGVDPDVVQEIRPVVDFFVDRSERMQHE